MTQRLQMISVTDPNVHNIALDGTFDDCQAPTPPQPRPQTQFHPNATATPTPTLTLTPP